MTLRPRKRKHLLTPYQSCHPQPTQTTGRRVFAGGTGPRLSFQASTTPSLCFGHHRRLPSSTRVAPVQKGAPSWLQTPCTAALQLREWLWNRSQVHSRLVLQSSDHGLRPGRCLHASPSACSSLGRLLGFPPDSTARLPFSSPLPVMCRHTRLSPRSSAQTPLERSIHVQTEGFDSYCDKFTSRST